MNKKNGLSRYRQRKLVFLFCADLTATQAAIVGGVNRNTVNRYYRRFREAIRDHQRDLQDRFVGTVEVDESYVVATRKRADPGSRMRGRFATGITAGGLPSMPVAVPVVAAPPTCW